LVPPRLGWQQWHRDWLRSAKPKPNVGSHVLFDGPTQSGKTVLARYLARDRSFVVVFGTKPRDASLDDYIDEGYIRIAEWPPPPKAWRKGGFDDTHARFILWPNIRKREDLRKPSIREQFAKCLDDAFINGGWTVVIDEGLWVSSRSGLNLGQALADFAYGAASGGASMYLLLQRPAGVPRVTWSSVMDACLFHSGVTADLRELASLGTYPPRDVIDTVKALSPPPPAGTDAPVDHPFLHLPCRGGKAWAVTEVEMDGR
jgi:hypothetical protein